MTRDDMAPSMTGRHACVTHVRGRDLNMLVMLTGKERTVTEMNALFTQAGFKPTRVVPTPSPFVVVEAVAG